MKYDNDLSTQCLVGIYTIKMKRIILTMTEQEKYEIIKTLVEKNGNKSQVFTRGGGAVFYIFVVIKNRFFVALVSI